MAKRPFLPPASAATPAMTLVLPLALALSMILAAAPPARADLEGNELGRVEALLNLLAAQKGVVFIRNGSEYSVDRAVGHLRTKLRRARGRISTCEQFIDHVASGSSISGKPYEVILPDGERLEMRTYLYRLLPGVDAGS